MIKTENWMKIAGDVLRFDLIWMAVSLCLYDHFPQLLHFYQSANVPPPKKESGWIKVGDC